MKQYLSRHWFRSFSYRLPGRQRRTHDRHRMTKIYAASTIGLVTAFGISSGFAASNNATPKQPTNSDASKTQVELRKQQRATNMNIDARHGTEDSSSTDDLRTESVTNHSQTTVTVNGENIPVPENGTTNRTMTSDDGSSHVDITVQNSTTGSDDSSAGRRTQRTRLNVDSSSSSTTRSSTSTVENSE